MIVRPSGRVSAAVSLGIFILNAALCWPLFGVEYLDYLYSNEGVFISLGRFVEEHGRHLGWQPWFNAGSPFENAYFVLTPVLTGAVAGLGRTSPAHAFHFLAALTFCVGPVFLFWFAREVSGRIAPAAGAALLWTLCSPAIVIPEIAAQVKSPWGSFRLSRLVVWGEMPHQLALSLALAALFLLARYWKEPRGGRFAMAGLAAAAAMLANAFGIAVVLVGSIFFLISVAFERGMERRVRSILTNKQPDWMRLASAAAILPAAYLASCRFLPPSLLWLIHLNSPAAIDYRMATKGGIFEALFLITMGALLILIRRLSDPMLRFAVLFFAFFGGIAVAGYAYIGFVPQPHRYMAEAEVGLCLLAAFGLEPVLRRVLRNAPGVTGRSAAALAAIVCILFAVEDYQYARQLVRPVDITQTGVYREAAWIGEHLPGQRVMAAGMSGFWFNVFADNPQLESALESSNPNWMQQVAVYTIYTGQNAGPEDGAISVLWLKAFGCGAVTVARPGSQDPYEAIQNPAKFDGLLPEVWREGADSIYQVPLRSTSLAHVVPASAIVSRQPIHGLDIEQVRRYVASLEDLALPEAAAYLGKPGCTGKS